MMRAERSQRFAGCPERRQFKVLQGHAAGKAARRLRGIRGATGAALLAAMLTVSLVATLASAALAIQWRGYEVEKAVRARLQAAWLLRGAVDRARLILGEDARSGGVDHLAQPWAIPVKEAKLTDFLGTNGADQHGDYRDSLEAVFLSGEITDLQSRLNVMNLVTADGFVSWPDYQAFQRLFAYLNLPSTELQRAIQSLAASRSEGRRPASLLPQRLDQLVWLGLSAETVAVLKPYVIVLPTRTALNLNTASPEAMYAAIEDASLGDARRLAAARLSAPFRTLGEAAKVLGPAGDSVTQSNIALGVATDYFQIAARLQMDDTTVEQRWVVQRTVSTVQLLWME
ncbi:MAG: gspK [Ramlibacter sp.]|nr:gspK [Ramlibacter sp.]